MLRLRYALKRPMQAVWTMEVDGKPVTRKKVYACEQAPQEESKSPAESCKTDDKKPTIHVPLGQRRSEH